MRIHIQKADIRTMRCSFKMKHFALIRVPENTCDAKNFWEEEKQIVSTKKFNKFGF